GHGSDYGFIGTVDTEVRRQRAKKVSYGIRDVWVNPIETVEEVAPTTLDGVNDRVTELATVQEQDTQDIYDVIKDTQDRQTQIYQRVDILAEDRQFHYETARLLELEALDSYPDAGLPHRLIGVTDDDIDCTGFITTWTVVSGIGTDSGTSASMNNMPPRRTSATTAKATAARAAAPMIAAAVEQLIKARVSAILANHETLRNSTNGHGDGSHNSDTGTRGTVR
ncbi:hypothetical protein Tco_0037135, partial [Tanacetum coccineum]